MNIHPSFSSKIHLFHKWIKNQEGFFVQYTSIIRVKLESPLKKPLSIPYYRDVREGFQNALNWLPKMLKRTIASRRVERKKMKMGPTKNWSHAETTSNWWLFTILVLWQICPIQKRHPFYDHLQAQYFGISTCRTDGESYPHEKHFHMQKRWRKLTKNSCRVIFNKLGLQWS